MPTPDQMQLQDEVIDKLLASTDVKIGEDLFGNDGLKKSTKTIDGKIIRSRDDELFRIYEARR